MILDINSQLEKIQQIRDGSFKEGLSLGIKPFDTYFRFKESSFDIFLGHSNVGKSHFVLYLMFLYSRKHKIKWLVFMSENEPYSVVKKIIEYSESLPINKIKEDRLDVCARWVDSHFKFISIDEIQSYNSILEVASDLKKSWDFKGLFIDPYNSLEKDSSMMKSLGNGYEYNYRACSEFRLFSHKNNVTIWLTCHAVTESLRKLHTGNHEYAGHPIAPMMSDCEGGGLFGNRSSNFCVIHRYVQHHTDWMITQMHVRKVKNTDTGMMPTPLQSPLRFSSIKNNVGFSIEGICMKNWSDGNTKTSLQKT